MKQYAYILANQTLLYGVTEYDMIPEIILYDFWEMSYAVKQEDPTKTACREIAFPVSHPIGSHCTVCSCF